MTAPTSTKRAGVPYFHRVVDLARPLDYQSVGAVKIPAQRHRVSAMSAPRAPLVLSRLIRPLRATRALEVA
jgi:hypothetical protein